MLKCITVHNINIDMYLFVADTVVFMYTVHILCSIFFELVEPFWLLKGFFILFYKQHDYII